MPESQVRMKRLQLPLELLNKQVFLKVKKLTSIKGKEISK
jgi:hypothetical protein